MTELQLRTFENFENSDGESSVGIENQKFIGPRPSTTKNILYNQTGRRPAKMGIGGARLLRSIAITVPTIVPTL